jgi:hypothetical protein
VRATDNSNVLVSLIVPDKIVPNFFKPGMVVKASKFMEPRDPVLKSKNDFII